MREAVHEAVQRCWFDGYRVQLHVVNEDVKFFTRRGHDWTKRFKKIATDAFLIDPSSAIVRKTAFRRPTVNERVF